MRPIVIRSGLFPLLFLLLPLAAAAQQPTRPLLSDAIRTTLEKDGPDAAMRRYREIARDQRDVYEFDLQGLGELSTRYFQAGDMVRGQVVIEIATEVAALVAGSPPVPSAARTPAPARPRRETGEEAARRRSLEILGPGRDDLARFQGVYGDPSAQDQATTPRNFFVDRTCDGHLRLGAMWGDVAPWSLKSVSETEFVEGFIPDGQPAAIRVQFQLTGDGRPTGLTHNMNEVWALAGEPARTRIARLDDLPPEWVPDCR